MNNSKNLNNLKIATAVAVFTMVASLAPEVAYAGGRGHADAQLINPQNVFISFDLDTSDPSKIQNFSASYQDGSGNYPDINPEFDSNSKIAPPSPSILPQSVTWEKSDVPISSVKDIPDLVSMLVQRTSDFSDNFTYLQSFFPGNPKELAYYDVHFSGTFNGNTTINGKPRQINYQNELVLLVPYTGDPTLDYNSLVSSSYSNKSNSKTPVELFFNSTLSNLAPRDILGSNMNPQNPLSLNIVVPERGSESDTLNIEPEPAVTVPEPTETAGLSAFGVIGAILLLRRNRHFSTCRSSQNAALSTQAGRSP